MAGQEGVAASPTPPPSPNFDPAERERQLRAESAAWDTSAPQPAREGDIPMIDVSAVLAGNDVAARESAADQLRTASEQVGFFQLTGHGITDDELAAILEQTRRFHALPAESKLRILMDRPGASLGGIGYLPVGARKLPSRAKGNLNEAFLIKSDREIGFDDNDWIDEDELPGFRTAVETYARRVEALARSLLPIYATALDLPPDFFAPAFLDPFWRLRMTHYPPVDRTVDDDEYGISPHVDTTFLTLLLQDGPGLRIFSHRRDAWIEAPVVEGAFVVNTGELLRQWSNDRFLSTRHFAHNSTPNSRYSVPFFFNATADYPMACLPSCHGPGNPPRYPTISYLQSQAAAQGE